MSQQYRTGILDKRDLEREDLNIEINYVFITV